MIERHDAERALAVGVHVLRHMGDRGGTFGALAARHALRLRRSPGGVEHDRPRIGSDTRLGRRCFARQQCQERDFAVLRGIEGDARAGFGDAGCAYGVRGHILEDDRLRFGILQVIIDLVVLRAPVDWRNHNAGELARPMDRRRLPAVLQHRDQMVAWHKAKLIKRGVDR